MPCYTHFFQPKLPPFSHPQPFGSQSPGAPGPARRRDGAAPALVDGADGSARGDQEHGQLDGQGGRGEQWV